MPADEALQAKDTRNRGMTRRAFAGSAASALLVPLLPRRAAAASSLGALSGALSATDAGMRPGAAGDQSGAFLKALRQAEAASLPLFLPPGRYEVAGISLPGRAHIIGVPGESRLVFGGGDAMLRGEQVQRLRLEGIVLDGAGLPVSALLDIETAGDLVIDDCEFVGSGGDGARLRATSGRVANSRFTSIGNVGIHVDQAVAMSVEGNTVDDCGNTGILVIRDDESEDGTIVRGNRVTRVRADSGGTGQNGNGINTAKANGVIVADNHIDQCAFSAIRCFSSDNTSVTGNIGTNSGEMALYVEFASEGAIVANNLIDGGNGGISITNFMRYGGRLATCSGNIVRNIRGGPTYPDGNRQNGAGINAEADVAITGNVVENAVWGLQLGWGPYLRDVTAVGNVIRSTKIGIAVSVVDGVGPSVISDNLIAGAEQGAILGMRWQDPATPELIGGETTVPSLTLSGNRSG